MFFPCSIKSRRCFYWVFFFLFSCFTRLGGLQKNCFYFLSFFLVCFLVAMGGGGIGIFFGFFNVFCLQR